MRKLLFVTFVFIGLIFLSVACGKTTTSPEATPVPTATYTPTPIVWIPVTITYLSVSPSNGSVTWQYVGAYDGISFSTPVSTCSYSTTVIQAPFADNFQVDMYDTQPAGPTTCVSQLIVSTPWNGPVTDNGVYLGSGWNATIIIWGVGQIGAPITVR